MLLNNLNQKPDVNIPKADLHTVHSKIHIPIFSLYSKNTT